MTDRFFWRVFAVAAWILMGCLGGVTLTDEDSGEVIAKLPGLCAGDRWWSRQVRVRVMRRHVALLKKLRMQLYINKMLDLQLEKAQLMVSNMTDRIQRAK